MSWPRSVSPSTHHSAGRDHDRVKRNGESYVKDFKPLELGILNLSKGRGMLTIRACDVPGRHVIDLRTVVLTLID